MEVDMASLWNFAVLGSGNGGRAFCGQLAELVSVEIPVTELCIRLASDLHGVNYFSKGYTLEKLGEHYK